MGSIDKVICTWNGLPGGVGNTVVYWKSGLTANAQPALKSLVQSWGPYLTTTVSVTIPNTGETLDDVTGKMTGTWNFGTVLTVTGTSAGAYTPQSGAQLRWFTGEFLNGRRIKGRTFVVPIAVSFFTTGGLVNTACHDALAAGAAAYVSNGANAPVIWQRPIYKKATTPGDPPTRVRDGSQHTITSSDVPTKVATLKGRRDV